MNKILCAILIICAILSFTGCMDAKPIDIVATTKPVYNFTSALCKGTDITVELLVTENISCLHDYTLQVQQMRAIEQADTIVLSGAGMEDFLHDAIAGKDCIIDASSNITLLCGTHHHNDENHEHHHEQDPHIWLNPENARQMIENICNGLCATHPESSDVFQNNLKTLTQQIDQLVAYGNNQLASLENRDLITFHDGFSYFAQAFNLNILHALEEESGSEASAKELKDLIQIVDQYNLSAIFVEENGSTAAAHTVARERDIGVYALNMGMSDKDYFETMYHNIDTVKEALE